MFPCLTSRFSLQSHHKRFNKCQRDYKVCANMIGAEDMGGRKILPIEAKTSDVILEESCKGMNYASLKERFHAIDSDRERWIFYIVHRFFYKLLDCP